MGLRGILDPHRIKLCRQSAYGLLVLAGRFVAGDDAVTQLRLQVMHAARGMGHHDHLGVAGSGDILEGVEVLGHENQIHDLAGVDLTVQSFLELGDRLLESLDDRLTLIGDTLTLELLALGLGFRLLDRQDLLGFTTLFGSNTLTTSSVDLVHRNLDLLVRVDVGDLDIDDLIAEVVHGACELLLDRAGDPLLVGEDVVEIDLGHLGADLIKDVGLDLAFRVAQPVERMLSTAFENLILNRDLDLDADLVLRDRFDRHRKLLDAQRESTSGAVDERNLHAETGAGDALELAEAFDGGQALLLDGEEGAESEEEEENQDHRADDCGDDESFHKLFTLKLVDEYTPDQYL